MKLIKQYSVLSDSDIKNTIIDNKELSQITDEKHYVSLLSNNLCKLATNLDKEKAELVDSAVDWLEDIINQKQAYQLDYDRLCRLGIDQQNLNDITINLLKKHVQYNKSEKEKNELLLLISDLQEIQEFYKQQVPQSDFYLKNTPKN